MKDNRTKQQFEQDKYMDGVRDTDENGLYPGEARDNLMDAVSREKSEREWELGKYSDQELKDELKRREDWHKTQDGRAPF